MIMSKFRNTSVILALAGTLSLFGCGQGNDQNASTENPATDSPTPAAEVATPPAASPPVTSLAVRELDPAQIASSQPQRLSPSAEKPLGRSLVSDDRNSLTKIGGSNTASLRTISTRGALKAEPASLNLGQMGTNETKSGIVTLTNTSDSPITIERAKTSCGCTTAGLNPGTVLAPGESIEVGISMRGAANAQVIRKTVTFIIPDMDPLVVPVTGQTIQYVKITPDLLDKASNPEGRITLTSIDGTPFRITGMSPQLMEPDEFSDEPSVEHVINFPWERFEEYGATRRITFHLTHPRAEQIYFSVKTDPGSLLTTNARVNAVVPTPQPSSKIDLAGRLMETGKNEEVLKLLENGLTLEIRDKTGQTVLALAAHSSDADFIQLLIERGADIEAPDGAGRTPLMIAAQNKNLSAIQVLIDVGARVSARDKIGNTPLSWAAGFGTPECVAEMIQSGADIEAVSSITGWTPLIWAAGFGDPLSVQVLIAAGANMEVGDMMQGATPLINAARTGKVQGIEFLLQAGAQIDTKDRNGKTALLAASEYAGGTAEKVKALINGGADLKATDNRGKTCYDLALARTDARAASVQALLRPYFTNTDVQTPED